MSVTEQLRKAIKTSGETHYRLWKESGVNSRAIDRFIDGEADVRGDTIDRLCDYLGLELRTKKQSTACKQPAKKRTVAKKKTR